METLRPDQLWQKLRHRTHKEKIMPDGSAPQTRPADPTIRKLGYTSDDGAGARARIGLLVLESDQTMEDEARALTALDGVALYHARLANDVVVTPESLAKMEQELPIAAGLIPAYMGLNAIGYGCTSGSTIIGEQRVAEIMNAAHPGIPTSNPLSAAKAALAELGVQRPALLTPYTPDVTLAMQANFAAAGLTVNLVGSFYEDSDLVVGKISPSSILQAIIDVGSSDDCDGVFVSCTSLRAADIIAQAEAAIGKPVTASNHAMVWHLMRLAGVDDIVEGRGQLFAKGLTA